ncbi:MAG: hypothetical protein ACKPEY_16440, partial [Planctomycetota bacterium]
VDSQRRWFEDDAIAKPVQFSVTEEFARIDYTDVTLPSPDDKTLKISFVSRPDQAPEILVDRLGLELSQRLSPFR